MNFIDIDFETKSEADIMAVGARKYAEHPSTEILMMSFSINGRPVVNFNPYTSKGRKNYPYQVLALVKIGWFIRAHNSEFEFWIWNLVATRQFNWTTVGVEQFYDTMAMSCAMAYPASLEKAGEAIGTDTQKQKQGKALINFFSKPSRKKDEDFKNPLLHSDKFNEFINYCDDDVRTQQSIANKTKLLSLFEHKVYILTEKMNIRGLPIDLKMVQGAIELVEVYQEKANDRAKEIIGEDLPFESLTQTAVVKNWLNENGCNIPNMQAPVIAEWLEKSNQEDLEEDYKISDDCKEILLLRSQCAKASTSKYKKIIAGYCDDGRIHGFIKYHIARTGRWGGRGVQIQNFPRPSQTLPKDIDWELVAEFIRDRDLETIEFLFGNPMDVLSGALRASICAPPGYKFVSADYSQVEARFVFWFADDKKGLEEFGGEGKIYEGMASEIYGIQKNKVGKDSFERFMGKQTILGAGFGMGARKFVSSCKEKGGVEVELSLAKKSIDGYRSRYPMVKKLWTNVEKAAIRAIKNPGSIHKYIHVSYQKRGKHLYCKLPSGRELCYPDATVGLRQGYYGLEEKLFYWGTDPFSKKWVQLDTWGGKLTENFVQAAARDVMAFGLLNCERKGYVSLFTVHDEGVSIVKEDYGSYKEYEKLMCTIPKWAKGCPIAAEGWEGKRYRK